MTRPDGKAETLGLQILDEPAAKQSDPTGIEFGKQYSLVVVNESERLFLKSS